MLEKSQQEIRSSKKSYYSKLLVQLSCTFCRLVADCNWSAIAFVVLSPWKQSKMIYTKLGQAADKAGVYSTQSLSILLKLCNLHLSKACCRFALQSLNAFPASGGTDMRSLEGKVTTPQYWTKAVIVLLALMFQLKWGLWCCKIMGQVNLIAALGYSCPSSFKRDVRSHYAPLLKQGTEMTLVSKPQTQLHISVQNKSWEKPGQNVNEAVF